jgi:hypothetical protein
MSQLSKQQLKVENNTEFPNNNSGQITPTRLRTFNEDMIDSTVNQTSFDSFSGSVASQFANITGSSTNTGSLLTTASFNSYTQSNDQRVSSLEAATASYAISSSVAAVDAAQQGQINALIAATGSYATAAITASSLITASLSGNTITFTKGDASTFGFTIPDVSGSTIDTGSFATTGSNNFNGNQIITGSVTISGSATTDLTVVGQIFVSSSATGATTQPRITVSGSAGRTLINRNSITIVNATDEGGMFPSTTYAKDSATFDEIGFTVDTSVFGITGWSTGPAFYINNTALDTYPAVFGFQNKANYTDGRVAVLTPLSASAGFTASLQNGYAWVGNGLGQNTQVATSSFGGGGSIDTGSFATTGSNTFIGNQTITGSLIVSGSSGHYIQLKSELASIDIGKDIPSRITFNDVIDLVVNFDGDAKFNGDNLQLEGPDPTFQLRDTNAPLYVSYGMRSKDAQLQFVDGVDNKTMVAMTTASVDVNTNINISGSLTASLQQGYAWVGNASGISTAVATSSFGGGSGTTFEKPSIETISGSVLITANSFTSGASSITHISGSSQNLANILFKTSNTAGSTIVSGSFNIYANGSAPAAGRLNYLENSNIFLNDSGFLPTVTASVLAAGGFYPRMRNNMWLGTGPWTINTNAFASSSVQAGSLTNNLFLGSAGTTINTLGNKGGIAFSHNLMAQASATINAPSRSLAEIAAGASGSTTVSFLNNAAFGGTITYNGPISASAAQQHSISGNSIQGTNTFNLQSGSRGYTISQNITNGTLTINDNTVFAPTLGSNNAFQNNNINGTVTLTNRASASISIISNTLSGFTITNDYDSSTNGTTGRTFAIQGNIIVGQIGNNIYFSGSAAGTGTTNDRGRGIYGSFIGGNRISASVTGDGNRHLVGAAIVGHGLNIYGTSLYDASNAALAGGQNGGSAFFGRWNAEDGNRALSAETIFAVGTGNSGSAGITRKTGFLIDSGSNTFIEGTLNVSGSSTLSGSLFIQSGSNLPTSTGSVLLTYNNVTGQVTQAPYSTIISSSVSSAEFWSTTTQSGSAGVSGSVSFNNSGSAYNVSLVNGTQLQVANAGVYNIQFSAQIETSAGADTIYLWFKKNGTNINDSASKAVLANNTAQIMTVNILDEAAANDYYEIAYQNINGHATVLAEAASGNIPAIPSVIATIFQIR